MAVTAVPPRRRRVRAPEAPATNPGSDGDRRTGERLIRDRTPTGPTLGAGEAGGRRPSIRDVRGAEANEERTPVRVLVTGGSGFLGGHVVPRLVARGYQVSALARSPAAAERVAALGAGAVAGDLDDPRSLDAAFAASGADALVSLASLGFGHAPAVVAAAEEAGVGRAVFVSTTAIFTSLPAPTKPVRLAAEEAIGASALAWTILRPTMIYGTPGDRNMARLLRALARLPVVPLPGGGRGLQQPVHVDDLAQAVVAALEAPAALRRAYDLAGPEPLTLAQVVHQAAAAAGRRPRAVPVPLAPAVALARAYEALVPSPRLRAEQVARLGEDKAVDIGPARADLGFSPRPFAEGIAAEAALVGVGGG